MWTSTLLRLKNSSNLPYNCSQSMSPVKRCSSNLILWTTFPAMPLTLTRHWSLLQPNVSAVWEPSLLRSGRGQGISATRNWYSPRADMNIVFGVSGYEYCLRSKKIRFVDLNRDELFRTRLRANYTGMKYLWLPRGVLEADFLVSMPKIKAHHWSGVTLSLKNMFGAVPGARYGWPK